jgi:transcriptional regulator with XRE-family HTH domain
MPTEPNKPVIDAARLAKLREKAIAARAEYAHKPGISELLTPEEIADGAPFYFDLIACVAQLKKAREAAGLTLAQVAEKSGLATETLCRLETGQITNPTWKTLGMYAATVRRHLKVDVTTELARREEKTADSVRDVQARTILVYGHSSEQPYGFRDEEALRQFIGYEVFARRNGTYRYTLTRDADVIVLSWGGQAHGHFEISGHRDPDATDRNIHADVTCTYLVRAAALYHTPVALFNDVGIRVMPHTPPITEALFENILRLAGGYWETRPRP